MRHFLNYYHFIFLLNLHTFSLSKGINRNNLRDDNISQRNTRKELDQNLVVELKDVFGFMFQDG